LRVQHVRFRNSSDSARSPHTRRDQVKLLEIQSSPRGESSDSIRLTKSFIEACKSDNTSIVVDTLNVWHERLGTTSRIVFAAGVRADGIRSARAASIWERRAAAELIVFVLYSPIASRHTNG
jgi:hypothetical protein